MDSKSNNRIVLLAIRPRFAESIMKGEKRVEFRKVGFRAKVSHIVVYASKPIQRVLGYFQVSHIIEDTPEHLWNRYRSMGGLSYEEFRDYYRDSDSGVAIEVGSVWQFREPMSIMKLDKSLYIPQSFAYLTKDIFQKMLNVIVENHYFRARAEV